MPWTAAAVIGGALISSDAAGKASGAQQDSTNRATAENQRQYDQTRADYAPYRAAGTQALGQLQSEMNTPTTAADAMSDPGYQFGLDQGQQALDRKTAAGGGRISGASLKAAAQYGTDYATTGYNAAYQRRQDRLNRLAAIAGVGQSATGGTAAAGSTAATNNANLYTAQGNAMGAASMAQGNIWGNAINSAAANWSRGNQTPTTTVGPAINASSNQG